MLTRRVFSSGGKIKPMSPPEFLLPLTKDKEVKMFLLCVTVNKILSLFTGWGLMYLRKYSLNAHLHTLHYTDAFRGQ